MTNTTISWDSEIEKILKANSPEDLDALELHLLGRKQGVLNDALKALGAMDPEERKTKGQELNVWKQKVTDAIVQRRGELMQGKLSALADTDALDVTLDLPKTERGHLHLIPQFIRQAEEVFGRMGFDVAEGNEIETEEYNFDLLNIRADHPARDAQDTFFVKDMPGYLLRTQTSPVQIHYMRSHEAPFRMICPGRVYRKESDATHSPLFHQIEGLMVGPDVSLANMKAVMSAAIRELVSPDIEFRFRTSFFPFVEPGLEVDMRHRNTSDAKWLEVGGCGMVHPNVLKNGGVDPQAFRGFAFGFGVERLVMIKHGITDLRAFYEGDMRFLRQF